LGGVIEAALFAPALTWTDVRPYTEVDYYVKRAGARLRACAQTGNAEIETEPRFSRGVG